MKFSHKMESVLLVITTILCTLLLMKLFYNLRSAVLWRVNCWFCNNNFWIKYIQRNCWTCPKCEQYNGFTKDGDYNKVLISPVDQIKTPNVFHKSPAKNGLCKMCNINQQLKVTQLANFVPMNENNFEQEIEFYKAQLEKAYKLCSPCRKVLQTKLHKEKESLLGSKLLEARTPEKKNNKKEKQNEIVRNVINNISNVVAALLIVLVAIELYGNVKKHDSLYKTICNIKSILYNFLERIFSIVKMKTLLTFPYLEDYFFDTHNILDINIISFNTGFNDLTQKALGSFGCCLQIIGHMWNINKLNYSIFIDLLWTVFVTTSLTNYLVTKNMLLISVIKLSALLAVFLVYRSMKVKPVKIVPKIAPKKLNLTNGSTKMHTNNEDISFDTDDDVSLSKFGLHNFTNSSTETLSPLNSSFTNGRSFTPRNDSLWSKPKHNSTFSVNSVTTKSPSPLSETVFIKPAFNKYQNLAKDDSDSDLDESISSLCISSPKKKTSKTNPVFALRKFTASPNFATPMPINRGRPLISPSKLGYSTSWVAGGYWGSDGERHLFNINGSRSSSQSSGFESQTSSMNQRNVFSQPSSREESICGEPDRTSILLDRFQNCNMNYAQNPQNFTPLSSPVFPQMQYNNHVRIPQPRFSQQSFVSQAVLSQQHNSMFKTPGGSGLIKLPQDNSFTSH
ncbi:unnamed protein product [Colias eurytheme]|nr:unnamed protein product [Colias eurytheme]